MSCHETSHDSSVLQCVAVRCSMLQHVAEMLQRCLLTLLMSHDSSVLQCLAVYCSVLQHVVEMSTDSTHYMSKGSSVLQRVAVCCSMLQRCLEARFLKLSRVVYKCVKSTIAITSYFTHRV